MADRAAVTMRKRKKYYNYRNKTWDLCWVTYHLSMHLYQVWWLRLKKYGHRDINIDRHIKCPLRTYLMRQHLHNQIRPIFKDNECLCHVWKWSDKNMIVAGLALIVNTRKKKSPKNRGYDKARDFLATCLALHLYQFDGSNLQRGIGCLYCTVIFLIVLCYHILVFLLSHGIV